MFPHREKKAQRSLIIYTASFLHYFIMNSNDMHFNGRCRIRRFSYFRTRLRALNAHLPTPASDMSRNVLHLLSPCVTVIVRIIIEYFIGLANVIQISFRLQQTFASCSFLRYFFYKKHSRRLNLSGITVSTLTEIKAYGNLKAFFLFTFSEIECLAC